MTQESAPGGNRIDRSGDRLYELFDNSACVMLLVESGSGTIVAANAAAVLYYDYARAELCGMSLEQLDALPPERRGTTFDLHRNYYRCRHRLKSGAIRDVEIYVTPVSDDRGLLHCCMIHDVSAYTQVARELREREFLFRSQFEHGNVGIAITSPANGFLEVNPRFCEMLGYTERELRGLTWADVLHPDDLQDTLDQYQRMVAAEIDEYAIEMRYVRKDGSLLDAHCTVACYREGGRLRFAIASVLDITARKVHERELKFLAHHDALTGLPNRLLLADRMHQAMAQANRRGRKLALAYLDLDGFKAVNDAYGHETGDQVLKIVAGRMQQALRASDTLARLGGDEFVAMLLDLDAVADSLTYVDRLLMAAATPVRIDGLTLQLSVSIGVTFYPQLKEVGDQQLLVQADRAMYRAKQEGRSQYYVLTERDLA